jgi:hypothetical protein
MAPARRGSSGWRARAGKREEGESLGKGRGERSGRLVFIEGEAKGRGAGEEDGRSAIKAISGGGVLNCGGIGEGEEEPAVFSSEGGERAWRSGRKVRSRGGPHTEVKERG